ncbi:MAG: SpoIIE family protein phosphatase [Crocinitomicaceae bacterium]|nr:SpoIIE family protein phosphatase [Crocinitomicaceae bacterium]
MEALIEERLEVSISEQDRLTSLEIKSREMDESIRYAGSIQQSVLPKEELFKGVFDDAFVMFQPKDVVGGDFYWFYQEGDDVYFAVGDCTGHGVPGALVNIAGNTILRQIMRLKGAKDPANIIGLLDEEMVSLFNEHLRSGEIRDGMDIAFCKFNIKDQKGYYCGAGRPLLLLRNGELIEYKKGLSSVGHSFTEKCFTTVEFDLIKGDCFYLFSDGYTNQFGGENGKKFNRKRFRNLLRSIENEEMDVQKKKLLLSYNNWKGDQEQIDDVCIVGVKV